MKSIPIFFFLSLLIIFSFVSCEEDPSSLGKDSLPKNDLIEIYELNSLDSSLQQSVVDFHDTEDTTWNLGISRRIFVGQNTIANVKTSLLIKFSINLPDSVLEPFKENNININNAWVELKPSFIIGEEGDAFDFEVHEVKTVWTSSFFDSDSLANLPREVPDVSSNKSITDSLIKFDIPTDLAQRWMKADADSSEINEGLLFEPALGSEKIYGFFSLHQANIVNGFDLIPNVNIVVEKVGEFTDTLKFFTIRDVHVVETLGSPLPLNDPDNFYLQGGFPIRANYFIDVSKIPQNSIVVDATLEFFYDSTESVFGNAPPDTIAVIMYEDSTNKQFLAGTRIRTLTRDGNNKKYTGDITAFVQRWSQGTDNQGIYVYITDERRALNRVALRSNNYSVEAMRPRLTIRYTNF